jgi:exopolyphosphatase/pppGpp-phosphohydrolase
MPLSSFHTLITAQYGAARAQLATDDVLVLLHIGPEQTAIAVGHGATPDATLTLAIGAQKTARESFKHKPPSPLELENAIVTVEDEVTRARSLVPAGARLVTTDTAISEIAILSGMASSAVVRLPLDAMERTFDRLAQVSLGRPVSLDTLPADHSFAATLLILREFMHHLQFADLTILCDQTD